MCVNGHTDRLQVQCKVFNTTYNPNRLRLGSRILHQRLKGPSVVSYYPPRIGTIRHLRSLYPEHDIIDDDEEDWVEHLNVATSRGKGTPKKKRTAAGKLQHQITRLSGINRGQNRKSSPNANSHEPHKKFRFSTSCSLGHPPSSAIADQTHHPTVLGPLSAQEVWAH